MGMNSMKKIEWTDIIGHHSDVNIFLINLSCLVKRFKTRKPHWERKEWGRVEQWRVELIEFPSTTFDCVSLLQLVWFKFSSQLVWKLWDCLKLQWRSDLKDNESLMTSQLTPQDETLTLSTWGLSQLVSHTWWRHLDPVLHQFWSYTFQWWRSWASLSKMLTKTRRNHIGTELTDGLYKSAIAWYREISRLPYTPASTSTSS